MIILSFIYMCMYIHIYAKRILKIIILWIATFGIDVFYITHLVDTIFSSVWFFFSEVFRHCKWVSVLHEAFDFFVWNNTALKNQYIHLIFFSPFNFDDCYLAFCFWLGVWWSENYFTVGGNAQNAYEKQKINVGQTVFDAASRGL